MLMVVMLRWTLDQGHLPILDQVCLIHIQRAESLLIRLQASGELEGTLPAVMLWVAMVPTGGQEVMRAAEVLVRHRAGMSVSRAPASTTQLGRVWGAQVVEAVVEVLAVAMRNAL